MSSVVSPCPWNLHNVLYYDTLSEGESCRNTIAASGTCTTPFATDDIECTTAFLHCCGIISATGYDNAGKCCTAPRVSASPLVAHLGARALLRQTTHLGALLVEIAPSADRLCQATGGEKMITGSRGQFHRRLRKFDRQKAFARRKEVRGFLELRVHHELISNLVDWVIHTTGTAPGSTAPGR